MDIRYNTKGYKILTPEGYKDFDGISYMGEKEVYQATLEDGSFIPATIDHEVYTSLDECKPISNLKIGDEVLTLRGKLKITKIECIGKEKVYDVLEVDGHRFYANGVLVHNCRFIGKSKTLINSDTIRKLLDETNKKSYKFVVDTDVRFYKDLDINSKYIVAIDPSMGVNGDFAALQVFEFPNFEQVAEWMSDSCNQNQQVEKMKAVCDFIYNDLRSKKSMNPEVYWTFENNTVGEGFLCALREKANDLYSPESYIESAKIISQEGNKRLGWTTNSRNRSAAVTMLKTKIEDETMKINSNKYVQQLSNYGLKEAKYQAKEGSHDDLISASLLAIMFFNQESKNLDLLKATNVIHTNKPSEILNDWIGDFMSTPFLGG